MSAQATQKAAEAQTPVEKQEEDQKEDAVVVEFRRWLKESPNIAIAVAAIQALTSVGKRSKATTVQELAIDLRAAADKLKACDPASISLAAGCELFNRYVTRTTLDIPDFEQCRKRLIERGEWFAQMSLTSRKKIAALADRFIRDNQVVLIHGFSRVVLAVLLHAARKGKNFKVVCTEARPNNAGYDAARELIKEGIPVTMVLDSAVAYVMDRVDFVLVGAEGVVENGGIINKIGTYQIAVVAKSLGKPVYVAAESYKFARLFPLNQQDLPQTKQPLLTPPDGKPMPDKVEVENPTCDYTPPNYITLLFTDLGILTPSAVSDELIKLYY